MPAWKNWRALVVFMARTEIGIDKIYWLSTGILLAGLPHWERLPVWIPLLHVALIAARIYIPKRHPLLWRTRKTAINLFRLFIMLGGIIAVYSTYGTFAGRDVGIALLVMLAALKIFESDSPRDFYISTYLGYFLVITNFFYEQTIPTAIYMFLVVIIMTASLIGFNDSGRQLAIGQKIKLSATLLLQSIPILLVLFILFPRIDGPLWGLPEDAFAAVTGIDDQMSPGSISRLVQSDEIAFRVTFDGRIPDQSQLYWRGPVLWQTDGRKWTRGSSSQAGNASPVEFYGERTSYELMLEPTNKKWVFALEMLEERPKGTYLTFDYQLKTKDIIQARQAYELSSFSEYRLGEISDDNLLRALALPEIYHQQARTLATDLKDRYQTPEQIIEATFEWFSKQDFKYTLNPPVLTGDSVDEFLFNSRSGFCEHYAAAFTVLMRSAGIPARVVTGYLGGEINPLGNYLVVRQYHAHAWNEVWLEDKGWVRIDPTAAISPNRVEQGIENAMPEAVIDVPLGIKNSSALTRIWQRMRNSADMINYQWAQWVLGYGPERQQLLMQMLGFGLVDWKQLTIMLVTLLGLALGLLTLYLLTRTVKASDPAKNYYDRFCKKLARVGLARQSDEGPIDYANRVATSKQELAAPVQRITDLYIKVRYASNKESLDALISAIKQFNPTRHSV